MVSLGFLAERMDLLSYVFISRRSTTKFCAESMETQECKVTS